MNVSADAFVATSSRAALRSSAPTGAVIDVSARPAAGHLAPIRRETASEEPVGARAWRLRLR